jgi:hypothetical protein
MLSDTPALGQASRKIDFPAMKSITELLVRAMGQSDPIDLESVGFGQATRLIHLCQKFDFQHIRSSLVSRLVFYAAIRPAQVFTFASYYNNIALASYVLANAYEQIFQEEEEEFGLFNLNECSKSYLLALMRCFYLYGRVLSKTGTCSEAQQEGIWRTCVAEFNPDVSAHSS